jgi:hypothetical protein
MSVSLSTDLTDPSAVPYFLWDEPLTVAEFRRRLTTSAPAEQIRLLSKLLREARDTDVWKFTSPEEVWRKWPDLYLHLGRRRRFWEFLFDRWRKEGLIGK